MMYWPILALFAPVTGSSMARQVLDSLMELNNQEHITLNDDVWDICDAVALDALFYTQVGNNEWSKYRQSPPTGSLEAASLFVNLFQMCTGASMYPVYLKQSILRHVTSCHHHNPDDTSVRSPTRIRTMTDLLRVSPAKLVDRGYIKPADLASLFYLLLTGKAHSGCKPFKFDPIKRKYHLDHGSGCTPEELNGLGRAFGLLVFYGVPIGPGVSIEMVHILMDERRDWNIDDVRRIEPERFTSHALTLRSKQQQAKADQIAYGIARDQYDLISGGFGEVIPRDKIRSAISSHDIHAMLVGDGHISPGTLRRRIKRSTAANHHSVPILLKYARDPLTARRLYHIITGLYHLPSGGMKTMFPVMKIKITRYDANSPRITADTDTRTLFIPEYSDEDRLRAELDYLLR
jgi:hypothetical protein